MTLHREHREYFAALFRSYLDSEIDIYEFERAFHDALHSKDPGEDDELFRITNNIFFDLDEYDPEVTQEEEEEEALTELTVRQRVAAYLKELEAD